MSTLRLILVLLCGALPSAAVAQPVTLYGLFDVGLESIDRVGPQRDRITRVPSTTGSLPSRLGLRGGEDLGGGLRAAFTLEAGIAPDTGQLAQGGRLFGRQAWVGLVAPWGTLSVGRIYTMSFWSMLDADLIGPAVFSTASLDSYLPNARVDNAVGYKASFGPLTVGATASLGRDAVNAGPSPAGTNCAGESAADALACRGWSAMLKFDREGYGAAVAIDRLRGGPGAFGGLVRSELVDQRVGVNGYLRRGPLKLAAGALFRSNAAAPAPRSTMVYGGASLALTPAWTLEGQWMRLRVHHAAESASLPVLRVVHAFSRRTAAYAMAGRIRNHGALALSVSGGAPGSAPEAGGSQTGTMIGMRHAF